MKYGRFIIFFFIFTVIAYLISVNKPIPQEESNVTVETSNPVSDTPVEGTTNEEPKEEYDIPPEGEKFITEEIINKDLPYNTYESPSDEIILKAAERYLNKSFGDKILNAHREKRMKMTCNEKALDMELRLRELNYLAETGYDPVGLEVKKSFYLNDLEIPCRN